jgi:hypothetical protein
MNNESEILAKQPAESLGAGDRVGDASAAEPAAARMLRASRFRFERRSSYCAETAWVWQRARFICAKPQ